jgi:N6-L-threonylcarbamoyladenine synthase
MIILGIETSCDETALCILEAETDKDGNTEVKILSNNVLSQIAIHKEYGGVFPMVAKREHAKNLTPLLKETLTEAMSDSRFKIQDSGKKNAESNSLGTCNLKLETILEREPELLRQLLEFIPTTEKPPIDIISVTYGPGLEPCLWTGLNLAKALSVAWNIPVVATNHMEGHILVSLLKRNEENPKHEIRNPKKTIIHHSSFIIQKPALPALALLISGGHTEIVLMKDKLQYEVVGRTRDDAVGEAFDKVARILGLPYPGGPQISALAEKARKFENHELGIMNYELNHEDLRGQEIKLPRPMIKSGNLDFSFSGLKTAVLYMVKKLPQPISEETKAEIAREFEDAVTEVIIEKVKKAIFEYGIKTLILGGGVVANKNIRKAFQKLAEETGELTLKIPEIDHATDNALMIALAGYLNKDKAITEATGLLDLKANGNLSFRVSKSN